MTVDGGDQIGLAEHGETIVGLFLGRQAGKSYTQKSYRRRTTGQEKTMAESGETDPVRDLIAETADALGRDLAGLSRAIGRNQTYVQQFLKRGIPRNLPEDVREKLANELKLAPERLRGVTPGKGGPRPVSPAAIATTQDEATVLNIYRNAPKDVQPVIMRAIIAMARR